MLKYYCMRVLRQCRIINKTPSLPSRGPMPIGDAVGMGVAVEMLHLSMQKTGSLAKSIRTPASSSS